LHWAKDWNTNGRFTRVAQNVLNLVFTYFPNTKLFAAKSFKDTLEGLVPYTERHFTRVNQLMTNSFIVDFTLESMDIFGSTGGELQQQPEYVAVHSQKGNHKEVTSATSEVVDGGVSEETHSEDEVREPADRNGDEEAENEDNEDEEQAPTRSSKAKTQGEVLSKKKKGKAEANEASGTGKKRKSHKTEETGENDDDDETNGARQRSAKKPKKDKKKGQ